jgi:hypothetical protein
MQINLTLISGQSLRIARELESQARPVMMPCLSEFGALIKAKQTMQYLQYRRLICSAAQNLDSKGAALRQYPTYPGACHLPFVLLPFELMIPGTRTAALSYRR